MILCRPVTYTPLGQKCEVVDAATGYVITCKGCDSKQRLIHMEDYICKSVKLFPKGTTQ